MTEWIVLLQLFVGLVLTVTGESTSCHMELSPSKVVVKYGDPVSVSCNTSVVTSEGLGWEASQGGTRLTNVTNLLWQVQSVTHWEMTPMCYIIDTICMKTLNLVIYTFPENISFRSNAVMVEHVEHELTCDIPNITPVDELIVRWYKEDMIVHTETLTNQTREPTNQSPVFMFKPSRNDNNVRFRCEAEMDLGPEGPRFHASSQNFKIEVKFGPDIKCSTLREGDILEERCEVTGNPSPHVEWLKDGRPVNPAASLRRNDTGTYMVKAEGFSFIKRNIQVDVLYGPEWTCPPTYTATENSHHNLSCSQGFPKPEEIWYKDEEEVERPQILSRRSAGLYVVTVSNNLSSHNFTLNLTVLYPPSEIFELEDAEVHTGATLGLKCSSAGYPRPNYSWSYYKTDNVREETEDGVSRLNIQDATGSNMGFYTCHAWNEQGNVSKTVRVTVKGAKQECPIKITPDKMVLQYQSRRQPVECKPTTSEANVKEIFWKTQQGGIIRNKNWFADTHKDWDPHPVCHGEFKGIGNCSKALHYTLYKTPESVSIKTMDNLSLPVEGTELQLLCDIISVAPAQNLHVRWMFYRGNETIKPESVGVNSNTSCIFSRNRSHASPLNVSCIMSITLQRIHNELQVRCEAELDLGPTESWSPNMTSSTFNLNVFYEPIINATKLPGRVPVFRGYPEVLVCEADGNPHPVIQWERKVTSHSSEIEYLQSEAILNVSEAGFYICRASNDLSSTTQVVEVVLLEDYLPLIAGFVALVVVIISVVFIFIYSIYYKNTKMRRYSLKNPKFKSQSGNVAHNGWDIQLPVTKLS